MIIPFAKEQGFDFSIEDIKEFEQSIIEQLDEEQLKDISAGGSIGFGLGAIICKLIGFGGLMSIGEEGAGVCVLIGFGWGGTGCLFVGI